MILLAFPIGKVEPAIPTIKVPGAYPYETPVQVPAPTISESSVLPTPAPFPYAESSPSLSASQDRDSRGANARRPLSAKTVREAKNVAWLRKRRQAHPKPNDRTLISVEELGPRNSGI